SAVLFARADDAKTRRALLIQQELHISGQRFALRAQILHAGLGKNFHGSPQSGQRQNWRIAQLPALRAAHGMKIWSHVEASFLVVSPPPGEAGNFERAGVTFVHEAT